VVLDVEVLTTLDELSDVTPQWDRLVVGSSLPRSAPALVVATYRHLGGPGISLRVLVARDGGEVVGVLPMTVSKRRFNLARYQIAGQGFLNTVSPAGIRGRESELADAFVRALQRMSPFPDTVRLGWMQCTSPWPTEMRRAWAGTEPHLRLLDSDPGLRVSFDNGGYEGWLARRDSKLRGQVRRRRRRIADEGFEVFVFNDVTRIHERLPTVIALWNRRREVRQDGGAIFDDRVLRMLQESVRALAERGRVWLTTIERGRECMGVGLSVAAGTVADGWIAGFDDTWSRFAPGICTMFASIEFAAGLGYSEYTLGIGGQPYKYGVSDSEVQLEQIEIERRGLRPLQSPFQLVPFEWRLETVARFDRCVARGRALLDRPAPSGQK